MHGGGLGSMCYIYSSFSDLVGDEIGRLGWGGQINHGGTVGFNLRVDILAVVLK
jgi:hypothetical protein